MSQSPKYVGDISVTMRSESMIIIFSLWIFTVLEKFFVFNLCIWTLFLTVLGSHNGQEKLEDSVSTSVHHSSTRLHLLHNQQEKDLVWRSN